MRFLTCLLLAVAMAWCGLHIAEPIDAHSATEVATRTGHPADQDRGTPDRMAHASHHHCPVAPEQKVAAVGEEPCRAPAPPFVKAPVQLASLSHAPPLQPPSA